MGKKRVWGGYLYRRGDTPPSNIRYPFLLLLQHCLRVPNPMRTLYLLPMLLLSQALPRDVHAAAAVPAYRILVFPLPVAGSTTTTSAVVAAATDFVAAALSSTGANGSFSVTVEALPSQPLAPMDALRGLYAAMVDGSAPVAAVVASSSDSSVAASHIAVSLRALGLPLLTFSPTFANDGSAALRVAPTWTDLATAVVGVALQFRWRAVRIVSSDDAFGLTGAYLLRSAALSAGVSVVASLSFTAGDSDSVTALAKTFADNANEEIALAWLSDDAAPHFYATAAATGAFTGAVKVTWVTTSAVLPAPGAAPEDACFGVIVVRDGSASSQSVSELEAATNANLDGAGSGDALYLGDAIYFATAALGGAIAGNSTTAWPFAALPCAGAALTVDCVALAALNNSGWKDAAMGGALQVLDALASPAAAAILAALPVSTGATTWQGYRKGAAGPLLVRTAYAIDAAAVTPTGELSRFMTWECVERDGVCQGAWEQQTAPIWASGTSVVPTDGESLRGTSQRVLVPLATPFVMQDPATGALTGYSIDVLAAIASQAGFLYTLTVANSTDSTDAHIQSVIDGTFDLYVGPTAITALRESIARMSQPYYENQERIVIRRPLANPVDLFAFLRPFSPNVWLCWLASIVFSGLLATYYAAAHEVWSVADADGTFRLVRAAHLAERLPNGLFHAGILFLTSLTETPANVFGKATSWVTLFAGAVLLATYTGAVAAALSQAPAAPYVSTIEAVQQLHPSRVGIAVNSTAASIYSGVVSRFFTALPAQDQLAALSRGDVDVLIASEGDVSFAIQAGQFCDIVMVGEALWPQGFGLVMPPFWSRGKTDEIDAGILRLDVSGQLAEMQAATWGTPVCPPFSPSVSVSGQVTLTQLGGLFSVLAIVQASLFVAAHARELVLLAARKCGRRVGSTAAPPKGGGSGVDDGGSVSGRTVAVVAADIATT